MFLVGINPFKSNHNAIAAPDKVPDACPLYKCKTITTYWTANTQLVMQFMIPVPGTDPLEWTPVGHAMPDIFTPASNENLPAKNGKGVATPFYYTTCFPLCGTDLAGNWQATQEVMLGATAIRGQAHAEIFLLACSQNPPNEKNKINPVNTNKSKPPLDPASPPPPTK